MEARTPSPASRPAASHFTFSSRSKIYGVLNDLEAVRILAQRLVDLGCGDQQVEILEGEDGARRLDPDGRHHGLVARLVRMLQAMTDERVHVERYTRELLLGRFVVSVSVPNRALYGPICEAFKDAGGHSVSAYGPFVVEQISA